MKNRRVRARAIEDFAAALQELRESVGNPPFREMSGRSGAISHTTLHEATKGNRLPSWGTTAEFVKACGADPAAYRERWEKANRAIRSASAGNPGASAANSVNDPPGELAIAAAGVGEPQTVHTSVKPQASSPADTISSSVSVSAPQSPPSPPGGTSEAPAPGPAPKARRRLPSTRRGAAVLVTTTVSTTAALTVGVVALVNQGSGPDRNNSNPFGVRPTTALSAANCPVIPTNPPVAPPARKGLGSVFIGDMTLPDCTHVGRGKTVTKVWRIKNIGTIPWKGYSLHRIEPQSADQCQTITEVPVNDTAPGKMVDIRTQVLTPRKPGLCYVRFKMVDAEGKVLFPGSRPVNFQIIVD